MTRKHTIRKALGLALGAALMLGAAAPALAQRDGRDRGRSDRGRPAPSHVDRDRGRDRGNDRASFRGHDGGGNRGNAKGHDRDNDRIGFGISFGSPVRETVIVDRTCVYHHCSERIERVCIEPGHYEARWIPPVTERRWNLCGHSYEAVVCPGRWEEVWVPACYEERVVKVCTPACYRRVVERYDPGVRIRIGGVFDF